MAVDRPNPLAALPVTKLQKLLTQLRFLLALPAGLALLYFVKRGPLWPGLLAVASGELIQLWASAHLHKNVAIATSGPYSRVRNPMYLGRFFVGFGFVSMTWRWYFLLSYTGLFALYAQARVLGEESRLRERFGEEYAQYCASVNRWRPWPRRRLSQARWSWEAVRRNHQLRVTAGVALMVALLWWRVQSPQTFGLER